MVKETSLLIYKFIIFIGSCPEVLLTTAVLNKITQFSKEHHCQSHFFNKAIGLITLLYRNTDTGLYSKLYEFFMAAFS